MISEEFEFSISQYAGGTLPMAERALLEARIQQDAEAQTVLREYQALDQNLKSLPLPEVEWESLAESISSAIGGPDAAPVANSYRMPSWIRALSVPLSLAASLLIIAGVGIRAYLSSHRAGPNRSEVAIVVSQPSPMAPRAAQRPEVMAQVSVFGGSRAEKSAGPAVIDVAVGPSNDSKDEPILVHYSDDVISRPSHVTVASGVIPEHDTPAIPFDMQ